MFSCRCGYGVNKSTFCWGKRKCTDVISAQSLRSYSSGEESNTSRRTERKRNRGRELTKNQNDKLLLTESCGEKAASRRSDNSAYEPIHPTQGGCSYTAVNTGLEQEVWTDLPGADKKRRRHANIQMRGWFHICEWAVRRIQTEPCTGFIGRIWKKWLP